MPPKANKPAAPKKPTKPSAKSKTGNTACSQAASNWQLAIRGKEPLDPQTYATLAKCRAMTRTAKQADDRARMGYNLSEQGAAALKGRLQKRFDQGLITQKSRDERLKMLLQQRKEKQAAVAAEPADKPMTGKNKIPESKQVQAMKNKLERMKGQFDSKFEDWSSQTRGHGGTPFIMDNSKGRAQYKRHQKGNESLSNLNKAIKEQEEKIQAAEYRHIGRHTQTKKSEKFVEKNPVSPGLQYLEQKGLVKSWPKKPEFHFVQGMDKTALITVDGRVGVARKYNGGTDEKFLAAKKLASIANSYNRTQSLVLSVRQKPGYGVARASAAGNRELVGLKMRDKGTVTTQPTFTLKQSSSQGGTGAGRSMGVLFQTEGTALDKAAQAGQKAPLAGQGSLFRGAAIDNKTTRRLEFNEAKRQAYSGTLDLSRESLKQIKIGGMEVTTSERPGIYNVFHSVTGRQMGIIDTTSGKDHRISTESYGYSEKNAQNLKKISEEMRKIKFKSELGSLASRQSTQGPSSYVFGRLSGKKSEEYRISFNPAARKIAQPETQPPKPAFSRQGQLAPGRGTGQRRARAQYLSGIRKNDPEMVVEAANRRFQLDNSKIKWSVTRSDDGQVSIGKALAPTNFQVYRDIAKQSIRKKLDKSRIAQPPQPKPFSRGGQLAPGRGTEAPERSQRIQRIRNKIIDKAKSVQNELRKVNTAKNKSNSPVWDSSYQKLVDRGSKAKARLANLAKATDNLKKLEPVKKVATGRGTEERKNLAQAKAEARKLINDTTVKVSSNSFYYNSHDPEKRAKTYSAGYTKDIQSNMRGQVKRAKTANDAKVILDVLKQHVTGMKTRIAAWANAESRTASWAVTGRGNFNSSRNSKRIDSAMNKSQEISDYSKGLENAVSRALLKKSDTGTAITRLAKIRTRLERRKSKLNSDKQIQTRTAVYSARGLDEFANATKEDRSQALKNSMGQLKQIDKDRKTILGRLKKITAAESNLKMQTRISRAL